MKAMQRKRAKEASVTFRLRLKAGAARFAVCLVMCSRKGGPKRLCGYAGRKFAANAAPDEHSKMYLDTITPFVLHNIWGSHV